MPVCAQDGVLTEAQLRDWRDCGFLVARDFFSKADVQRLQSESGQLLTKRRDLICLENLRCRYMAHHESGELLFEVFDPVNDIAPVCAEFCANERLLSMLELLYGEPACLFKEKLIFKPPGALGYQLHQDIPLAWEGFPMSFLTVLIAIDPSTQENGGTEVFSGYHQDFLSKDDSLYMLPDEAVDRSRGTLLELQPGDVALFHGLTPHRSAPNRSSLMRRVLYASYNAFSDGGDQRSAHYLAFRDKMAKHRKTQTSAPLFFR